MFSCACTDCGGQQYTTQDGLGAVQGGVVIVKFKVKDFRKWYAVFEELRSTPAFAVFTATFVGEHKLCTGFFTQASFAHIVHEFPVGKEDEVRACYDSDWRGLATSDVSLVFGTVAFKDSSEDTADVHMMATVTHTPKTRESWLDAVTAVKFPPSKIIVAHGDDCSLTVHLFAKSVEKDVRDILAFDDVAAYVVPPFEYTFSALLFKKS